MKEIFENTMFCGVLLTLVSYGIGLFLKQKLKAAVFNPLLIATVISIAFVAFFKIDLKIYADSTKIISYLLESDNRRNCCRHFHKHVDDACRLCCL